MVEALLVALASPLLLFPIEPLPWTGLAVLVLSVGRRGLGSGKWLVRTPLDRPILILLLMLFVSLYPSVDLALSWPKFFAMLLGFSVFYTTVSAVSQRRGFRLGVWLLIGSIWVTSAVGLVGTNWSEGKYGWLSSVYVAIPRVITEVQGSMGTVSGIHPNELGGTLSFLLPLPLALLIGARNSFRSSAVLSGTVALGLAVLALSASRSAIIGFSVATIALLIWRYPLWRKGVLWALLAIAAVSLAFFTGLSAPDFMDVRRLTGVSDSISGKADFVTREEIWTRGRYMIEDFPFTGIGLNTFDVVLDNLYPLAGDSRNRQLAHSHNVFLQSAVDLGLGGLMGFLGLWACALGAGLQAYRRLCREPSISPAARESTAIAAAVVGLLAGLLAFLVFGLTDAITLGAKPLVSLWLMLGLIVAAGRLRYRVSSDTGNRLAVAGQPSMLDPRSSTLHRQPTAHYPLSLLADAYWVAAFFLVGMGYLVVLMGILR